MPYQITGLYLLGKATLLNGEIVVAEDEQRDRPHNRPENTPERKIDHRRLLLWSAHVRERRVVAMVVDHVDVELADVRHRVEEIQLEPAPQHAHHRADHVDAVSYTHLRAHETRH